MIRKELTNIGAAPILKPENSTGVTDCQSVVPSMFDEDFSLQFHYNVRQYVAGRRMVRGSRRTSQRTG